MTLRNFLKVDLIQLGKDLYFIALVTGIVGALLGDWVISNSGLESDLAEHSILAQRIAKICVMFCLMGWVFWASSKIMTLINKLLKRQLPGDA